MKIDLKKFLSLPLNDGTEYWNYTKCCGCIKGIFNESLINSGHQASDFFTACDMVMFMGSRYGLPICSMSKPELGPLRLGRWEVRSSLPCTNPKLAQALDIGEYILLRGYPQKGKLYVAHMVEKFQLCEIVRESQKEKYEIQSQLG